MSMLSSVRTTRSIVEVSTFSYRDVAPPLPAIEEEIAPPPPEPVQVAVEEGPQGPTPEEIASMVEAARREAIAATEARLKGQHQREIEAQRARLDETVARFAQERKEYFGKVERDVVELALSIAAKILHRESQLDPLLLATLVRVAIEKLNSGAAVRLRVPSSDVAVWSNHFKGQIKGHDVDVVGDDALNAGDCYLETSLGSANFGIDSQLKEVEQGFFDLLSRRPEAA